MLRKRSRATSSKQALMAYSIPSPTDKYRKPASSLLISPSLFTPKSLSETEAVMSPTSILDNKPFSGLKKPLWSETSTPRNPETETKRLWDNLDSKGIGLAIVDALNEEKSDSKPSKLESRTVLFGSQLKIQIPHPPNSVLSPAESPKSPADFGIKTRNCQLNYFSSGSSQSAAKKSAFGTGYSGLETPSSSRVITGCLSASEMELSEDYTCVISHGPNPKTTHIFEDCIVESSFTEVGFSSKRENGFLTNQSSSYPPENFLSFCYSCKKNLDHGKDIYMYRGEKSFCSSECRQQQMLLEEEGMDKYEPDDDHGTCSWVAT